MDWKLCANEIRNPKLYVPIVLMIPNLCCWYWAVFNGRVRDRMVPATGSIPDPRRDIADSPAQGSDTRFNLGAVQTRRPRSDCGYEQTDPAGIVIKRRNLKWVSTERATETLNQKRWFHLQSWCEYLQNKLSNPNLSAGLVTKQFRDVTKVSRLLFWIVMHLLVCFPVTN